MTKDHEVDENPREALTPVDPLTRQKYYGSSKPKSYVQYVPGHCDRIVWRGSYYMLPLPSAPSPVETTAPNKEVNDLRNHIFNGVDLIEHLLRDPTDTAKAWAREWCATEIARGAVELRVLCICPPGVSRIDCPACGNDAHRLSPPPPDPIVGENEDMGSAAPPPLKASGEYQTYPGEPITGIYEAGIAIVRLGKDDEATGE